MITEQKATELARSTLSEKRFIHTINVKNLAVELAEIYGADKQKATLAALLHDISKEETDDKLLQICSRDDIMNRNAKISVPRLWHAFAAAVVVKQDFGIDDEEIINAIAYHTTGRVGMTLLDKIIYIADKTSAERNYSEAIELRELAKKDIDAAVILTLEHVIEYMKNKGEAVDDIAFKVLKSLKEQ